MPVTTLLYTEDCRKLLSRIPNASIHAIISDIPYGISYDVWDVLYANTNSALLGHSPAQKEAGRVFARRGKPLNGWSKDDHNIGKEYQAWCSTWADAWLRVLTPGASALVFAGRRLAHRCICALEDAGFLFKDMIAWEKPSAPHRAQRISLIYERRGDTASAQQWDGWRVGNLRPLFEPILWFQKPYPIGGTLADTVRDYGTGAFHNDFWKTYRSDCANLIRVPNHPNDHGLHPTQKPVELLKALIGLVTQKGQTVLDPFCGSGSTLMAAKELGRNSIGSQLLATEVASLGELSYPNLLR